MLDYCNNTAIHLLVVLFEVEVTNFLLSFLGSKNSTASFFFLQAQDLIMRFNPCTAVE